MGATVNLEELFERRLIYPDISANERLSDLVGLDDHKSRLTKTLSVLVNPVSLEEWASKHYSNVPAIVKTVLARPPLVILAGDVGSGKTELAETIGDAVARMEDIDITLFPLSLSSRGQGRVGEMTLLLSSAFDFILTEAKKLSSTNRKARGGLILLVDEADALAQSREAAQMHHEDRAGVNAFIRGIDNISNNKVPVAVIMCTNRPGALDPAIKRRAADILYFKRPDEGQRRIIFDRVLKDLGFSDIELKQLVTDTGPNNNIEYGFTFSDITQRLLPAIVLDAYPDNAVDPKRAIELTHQIVPTPPFQEHSE